MQLKSENFHTAFHDLSQLLSQRRALWSESAFVNDTVGWSATYPDLHQDLLSLSDEDLMGLDDEPTLLRRLSSHMPELGTLADWCIPALDEPQWRTPRQADFGLPGRKKRQTEGFVSALLPLLTRTETEATSRSNIVDWCSGRGLLARQLYYASRTPVLCLERDPDLCRSGQIANMKMDAELSKTVSFEVQDVLTSIDSEHLENAYLQTALHACGDLHITMLKTAAKTRTRGIACSPCCYHLMGSETYAALSQEGRRAGLTLSKDQLRLATAETQTANKLERELRQRELLWRVAFDLYLRDVSGVNQYCRMPSIKKSLLKGTFAEFFQTMMATVDDNDFRTVRFAPMCEPEEMKLLDRAKRKMAVTRRLEKAQLGFRKALEYWLLLDRALYLQERGYQVELRQFCSKQDSGRNVVILGRRR